MSDYVSAFGRLEAAVEYFLDGLCNEEQLKDALEAAQRSVKDNEGD